MTLGSVKLSLEKIGYNKNIFTTWGYNSKKSTKVGGKNQSTRYIIQTQILI